MNDTNVPNCSFCGVPYSPETPLIVGAEGHICESCVQLAGKVVGSWGRSRKIAKPLKRPPPPAEIKAKLDQHIIGQEQAKEVLSVAIYNHYKRLGAGMEQPGMPMGDENGVRIEKSNILLVGPSGTGKTLLARTLANIVDMPFAVADATTLTQAGYVGDDVETILYRLLDSAEGDIERANWGIVYIDEIDKISRSGESSIGSRDVSGEGVQQALLKLVEGTEVKLGQKGNGRERGEEKTLNTENILFIVGGAFAGLEKIVASRREKTNTGIGFNAALREKRDEKEVEKEALANIQTEDLRRFGIIPEFIGRFPVISALEPLDSDALVRILTEPRNALIKQYRKIFEYDGVTLEFTEAALHAIADKALALGTGARGLRSILDGLLHKPMFEIPSSKDIKSCMVDVGDDGEIEIRSSHYDAADDSQGQGEPVAAGR